MIKELSELGRLICSKKYGRWDHVALKEEPVLIDLVIDGEGNFCKFVQFEKRMTIAEALTSKKGRARLLLDRAEEVLGYGAASAKKHELFLNKLAEYEDVPALSPVWLFYRSNKGFGVDMAREEFARQIPDPKDRGGNIAFRLQGAGNRIHEESDVLRSITEKYESTHKIGKECSICFGANYPVGDIPHGMIRGVPDGQPSGSALVSYNEDAFESYGLSGNNNSAICAGCARSYVEGLNWLLSEGSEAVAKTAKGREKRTFRYTNRKRFGADTAMVYWTRGNRAVEEMDYLDAPNAADVARLIESISCGTERDSRFIEPDVFYSCVLSGCAGRIAVRDWIEVSLFDLRVSIARWFQDVSIGTYDRETMGFETHYPKLYELARCCQRRNSDGSVDKDDTSLARVGACLWRVALKRDAAPAPWVLTKVLHRARLGGVTPDRAALIRLILNRSNRGGDFMITEKVIDGRRPVAYVFGQIFAKLESIQFAALGERNAGIREKYFTYAMTSPAAAFGRLFSLNSKHFTKLKNDKPGLAVALDKELQELCKNVDVRTFPPTFTLEQQGQFAIGYYHQRQSQFSGRSE